MEIHIRYFAVVRERLGRDGEQLDLHDGATVADALARLVERHAALAPYANLVGAAVNQQMVARSHILHDGDELALIPPVAGGTVRARVMDAPLSLDRAIAQVTDAARGAIVTFCGCVRDHNESHAVTELHYEAYTEMAEKVMDDIIGELERENPGVRIAVEHRIGTLAVGDVAVVIAVAGPHRDEAFSACRAMIDRLKQRTPIWKKETGPDGQQWIGTRP